MSLSIKVSNDEGKPFLPGSLVLGVVELVLHNDQPIGELAINFNGRTQVLLVNAYGDMTTSRRDYKSVGYLFSRHLNLYQGKYTHRQGRYMWPFAFRIPISASPRALSPESKDFFHPERPWWSDYNVDLHPLPPSFSYGGRFICFVEYTLHATLTRPVRTPISLYKCLSATKAVQVQAAMQEPQLSLCNNGPYTTYRHNFRFKLGNPASTMGNSLWSNFCQIQRRFRPKRTEKLELQVSVRLPRTIILEKQATLPVVVAATVRAINSDDMSQQNPDSGNIQYKNLVIRSFKTSLFQLTQVRAGCHRASAERRVSVRKGSCIVPLSGSSILAPGASEVSNRDTGAAVHVNLADIAGSTIPTTTLTLTPDFSTYNVANSHFLNISLKMEYANKRFKFHLRHIPIRVLSSECCVLNPSEICQGELSSSQGSWEEAWILPPSSESEHDTLFADPPPYYRA